MKLTPRNLLRLLATALLLSATGGCRNTVHGVGRDFEKAGHTIERAVN